MADQTTKFIDVFVTFLDMKQNALIENINFCSLSKANIRELFSRSNWPCTYNYAHGYLLFSRSPKKHHLRAGVPLVMAYFCCLCRNVMDGFSSFTTDERIEVNNPVVLDTNHIGNGFITCFDFSSVPIIS